MRFTALVVFFLLFLASKAEAEFGPNNLLLVTNGSLASSVALGEEYRKLRGIDPSRLLTIPLPQAEEISRASYERDLVLPIREAISSRKLSPEIRVLVLFWGVPLKVQAPATEAFLPEYRERLTTEDFTKIPSVMPTLPELQSWGRILQRDSSFRAVSLMAHLSYLAERTAGLTAYRAEVDKRFSYHEGAASVDSELQFLWYDRDQYPIRSRIENPFYHGQGIASGPFPYLLVSRIDGSSPQAARGLFLRAHEAEAQTLSGKTYIDARGLEPDAGGLGEYDEYLRALSRLLRLQNQLPIILDNQEKRFSEFGEAPDVAFYCGWYRLRHYEDAFTFRPGAIGYHIASEELVSLHDPKETGWCKSAVDHGITVTLGAVEEPYVDSFPSPLEFFGLIGTGRYSVLEAYALTSKVASWQMVLLADPLYNPFRKSPLLPPEKLVEHPDWPKSLRSLPLPPSEISFPDPLLLRDQEATVRRLAMQEVERLLSSP